MNMYGWNGYEKRRLKRAVKQARKVLYSSRNFSHLFRLVPLIVTCYNNPDILFGEFYD